VFKIKNLNKSNLKHYLIPFLIVTIILLLIGFSSINLIRNYVYQDREEESLEIANSYSLSLNKAEEAVQLTEDILSEKLIYDSQMAVIHKDEYRNNLDEMVELLNVDVLYLYNGDAVVIASSDGNFIGWRAGKGHPVREFLDSDQESDVGPIRADTESGIYYKYAYHRAEDGTFIQLGIEAEKIHSFISSFEINKLLQDILNSSESTEISYLNQSYLIEASTNPELLNRQLNNQELIKKLEGGQYYSSTTRGDENNYFYTVVPVSGNNQGYLAIKYPLIETQQLITNVRRFIFITLLIIYVFFSYSFYNLYQKNKKLQQSVYFDSLTNLPQKQYLIELLEEKSAKNDKGVLFLIDFKNLSLINLTYGYDYGDQFIKTIADKLKALENRQNQVFRFSAAEFAIYQEEELTKAELIKRAEKINHLFDQTVLMGELDEEYFEMYIGIEVIDQKYQNAEDILRNTTIALESAKDSKVFYSFFDSRVKDELKKDKIIERELKQAILEDDQDKLYLNFQPFYNQKSKVVGFEALARMESEYYGSISPDKFIQIAEKKHLILKLTDLVLKRAALFSKELKKRGLNGLVISVNLSVLDVMQDNFSSKVINIIETNGAKPENFMALRYLVWVIQIAYININGNAKLKISMNAV
jgi:diguanylate cyclase (GGDEF)-like protein